MSTKAKIQKIRAEVEAHEERGWLKGYEEGMAKREAQIVEAQAALEARNERIRELSHQKNGPKTAREALDLAWDLAHPVKVGQAVPAGTEIISVRSEIERAYGTTLADQVADGFDELHTRTLDPLPDPEPDWLSAPAVIATGPKGTKGVWTQVPLPGPIEYWTGDGPERVPWSELTDVTPLHTMPQEEPLAGAYRDVFDTFFATKKDES